MNPLPQLPVVAQSTLKSCIDALATSGLINGADAELLLRFLGCPMRNHFTRDRLPDPVSYYTGTAALRPIGRDKWRSALFTMTSTRA